MLIPGGCRIWSFLQLREILFIIAMINSSFFPPPPVFIIFVLSSSAICFLPCLSPPHLSPLPPFSTPFSRLFYWQIILNQIPDIMSFQLYILAYTSLNTAFSNIITLPLLHTQVNVKIPQKSSRLRHIQVSLFKMFLYLVLWDPNNVHTILKSLNLKLSPSLLFIFPFFFSDN